jgi:hypothetical protein
MVRPTTTPTATRNQKNIFAPMGGHGFRPPGG